MGREATFACQNHGLGRSTNLGIHHYVDTTEDTQMDYSCSSPRYNEDQSTSLPQTSPLHLSPQNFAQDLFSHDLERSSNPHDAYLSLPSPSFPSSPSYPHSLRGPGIEGGIPLPPRHNETILTGWTPSNGQEYEVVELQLPSCTAPPPPSHPHPPVPRKEKKQQTLACLFCRERKIACGRPSAGNPDQTCKYVSLFCSFLCRCLRFGCILMFCVLSFFSFPLCL